MAKIKLVSLLSLLGLLGALSYGAVGRSQLPQPSVKLATEPSTSQLLPFEADAAQPQNPVQMTLQALEATGKPLQNANIHVKLLTPPTNPWLPTDFPIVEGTKLLDLAAIAANGQLQFQQMLPIRGDYQLQVEVTPTVANAFAPFQQTLTLSVAENSIKYRNFAILAVILVAVGFGGGWVIGGKQELQPGEIAPQRVRLLLSGAIVVASAALLVVNISAELSHSHEHSHEHEHGDKAIAALPSSLKTQGLEVKLLGHHHATVGEPAELVVRAIDVKTGQPATDVVFDIKAKSLEAGWVAFAHQATPNNQGEFAWQQQFFDGAPHQVEVEVTPKPGAARQFSSFKVAQEIEVEGVEPPLRSRLLGLGYFVSILLVGLGLGLWIQQRRQPRSLLDSKALN
ncbi:hypothetical protein [Trichocoleus sp. FACHB-262]|uniref:hypothetical protein n=1 Tax=Trichocoleus sp. FACHB-262 TaxID=2692869 RepID=UPI001687CEE6|nr:hypothetical protein [Trichocoleus sp. FACHB-262]MBD2122071.1 hypothetical protein [Trichocoleus sp. FACHB-262]